MNLGLVGAWFLLLKDHWQKLLWFLLGEVLLLVTQGGTVSLGAQWLVFVLGLPVLIFLILMGIVAVVLWLLKMLALSDEDMAEKYDEI